MIENEKKSGLEPIVVFLLISTLLHGFLFYLIPKLPKPTPKTEKPISVRFIEEPVKGKQTPPKKATVLGKKNITVKKERRPEDKPKVEGEKKAARPQPIPPSNRPVSPKPGAVKPEIKLRPLPHTPSSPKKVARAKSKPESEKKVQPVPKIKRTHKAQLPEKALSTPKKERIKIAKAAPKPRTPAPQKTKKEPLASKPDHTPKNLAKPKEPSLSTGPSAPATPRAKVPPASAPTSLFPSDETLRQIERKFSKSYPKEVEKGDTISLNTKDFRYISYFTHIKRKIELVWEYPRIAADMGQEGRLLLRFTILKDGRLGGIKLLHSSGYRLLDEEAIRAVKEAAPFNPIPKRLQKNRINILATFTYTLGFKFVY